MSQLGVKKIEWWQQESTLWRTFSATVASGLLAGNMYFLLQEAFSLKFSSCLLQFPPKLGFVTWVGVAHIWKYVCFYPGRNRHMRKVRSTRKASSFLSGKSCHQISAMLILLQLSIGACSMLFFVWKIIGSNGLFISIRLEPVMHIVYKHIGYS
jgi:hypothetical protein